MRIVIGPRYVAQESFRHEASRDNGCCSDQPLARVAPEIERVLIDVYANTIDVNLLGDVTGNHVGVIPVSFRLSYCFLADASARYKALVMLACITLSSGSSVKK